MSNTAESLRADLRNLASDTEQVIKAAAHSSDEHVAALRTRLEGQLQRLRMQAGEIEAGALRQAREAARVTDETVRAHPYGAIGIAAAAGLLIGFLAARR